VPQKLTWGAQTATAHEVGSTKKRRGGDSSGTSEGRASQKEGVKEEGRNRRTGEGEDRKKQARGC